MFQGREITDKKFQLDALDGLRGLAVLLVFLSHSSHKGDYLLPYFNLAGVGKSGVYLFFVLSAFLLTCPFLARGQGALDKIFLLNYGMRRFLRIYPLYFLYLLIGLLTTLLLAPLIESEESLKLPFTLTSKEFVDHLLLRQGKGVTWSILAEFRYYFVLPVLALTFSLLLKNRLIPCGILTIVLILIGQYFWPQQESLTNDSRMGPYLPIFFMGSYLAVLHHHWREKQLSQIRSFRIGLEVLGIAAVAILILMTPSVASFMMGERIHFNYSHREFILYGMLWSMVVYASVNGFGFLQRMFEWPVLRYMGFISFSVYLLHDPVIHYVHISALPKILHGWTMLLVTVGLSHLSWILVEKPPSYFRLKGSAAPMRTANTGSG